jgi:anthraniloyl-CoA monooxygenase
MRIAVVGGGPGGLYLSILMRKIRPDWELTLYERNAASDAFGFGVVFSDETLTVFEHADPETYSQIAERFTRWTDIDIHHRGHMTTSGGHGFSAIGRRELLRILQERAVGLGADVRFCTPAPALEELGWADLIVGADGASSGCARHSPGTSSPRSTAVSAATSGWVPTWRSRRSSSSSPRPSTVSSRPTPIRTTTA